MELTDYELKIDGFIKKNTNSRVAGAIRLLIQQAHDQPINHKDKQFRKLISTAHPYHRLKPADFKKMVTQTIIYHISSEEARKRAGVVFKLINNDFSLEELENGLTIINEERRFPSGERGARGIGKYRALGNIFQKPEKTPSEATLKLCIAILDLNLIELTKFIELYDKTSFDKENNEIVYPKGNNKNYEFPFINKKSLLIFTVATILIVATITISVKYRDGFQPQQDETSFDKKVSSSNLFGLNIDLTTENFTGDSMKLELISVSPMGSAHMLEGKPVAIDSCFVRFMVKNYSNQYIFPDNLLISFNTDPIKAFPRNITTHQFDPSTPKFYINPNSMMNKISITNDTAFPFIPPKSLFTGSIKLKVIDLNKSQLITGRLTLSAHSKKISLINIASEQQLQIITSEM